METTKNDNPYINTKLYTRISVKPEQMNNNIYINLRYNLLNKLENKCYKDYGYISKIYGIDDIKHGKIYGENLSSSATYNVEFSCRLCRPIENMNIICKIIRINRALITAENGPILVIIVSDKINNDIFFTDNNNILRYKSDNKSKKLESGDFVVVTILNKTFNDGDDKIKIIGYLNNIASDKNIEEYYENIYNKNE
jgi:DNA-directed RNA polymerase subunit E'/Rpb7